MTYPGKMGPEQAEAMGLIEPLDLRTIEEQGADAVAALESLRETLTGLPARPGTIR